MKIAAVTRNVQTLIMAGGRGERLYPLTAFRPKPAVPFGGVFRIVDFTLSNCLNSRLTNVSLLTQYKHEELHSYIRHSWSGLWSGLAREPLACLPPREAGCYRGTADAVFQNLDALQKNGPEFVLILSADQVYRMDYREILKSHAETNADLTIATVEHSLEFSRQFGVVDVDDQDRIVGFQEKPSNPKPLTSSSNEARVNMGVYVFKRAALLQTLSENCSKHIRFDFGRHVIPSLIGTAHVRAYKFFDVAKNRPHYWRDIGTIDAYHEANMDLLGPEATFDPFENPYWPSYPSSRFRNSSEIRSPLRTNCQIERSIVSPGVHIEDDADVESSVLMSRVCIGKRARIRHAIIEEGVQIPGGTRIGFDLEKDRKYHFVTDSGIVVVSHSPKSTRHTTNWAPRYVESRLRLLRSV